MAKKPMKNKVRMSAPPEEKTPTQSAWGTKLLVGGLLIAGVATAVHVSNKDSEVIQPTKHVSDMTSRKISSTTWEYSFPKPGGAVNDTLAGVPLKLEVRDPDSASRVLPIVNPHDHAEFAAIYLKLETMNKGLDQLSKSNKSKASVQQVKDLQKVVNELVGQFAEYMSKNTEQARENTAKEKYTKAVGKLEAIFNGMKKPNGWKRFWHKVGVQDQAYILVQEMLARLKDPTQLQLTESELSARTRRIDLVTTDDVVTPAETKGFR